MIKTMFAALAPAALMAVPAVAAPAAPASIVVAYADLDLARADHQVLLAERVERAARTACERPFIRDLKSMVAYESCIADTVDEVQAQLAEFDAPAAAVLAAR